MTFGSLHKQLYVTSKAGVSRSISIALVRNVSTEHAAGSKGTQHGLLGVFHACNHHPTHLNIFNPSVSEGPHHAASIP